MYTNTVSPIMVIRGSAAKKAFHSNKSVVELNREKIIRKARKDLRKAGLDI